MQRAAELAELLDSCVDILDAPGEIPHFSAGRRVVFAQPSGGELLDVVKRQPKRLSLLDELHLVHHCVRVHAEAAFRAPRRTHKSTLLVVPKCLNRDASAFGNSSPTSIDPEVNFRVKCLDSEGEARPQ